MSQPYDVPLFGDPDPPKAQRVQSHKDRDDAANKIIWTRYKVPGVQCSDCVTGTRAGSGIGSWLRTKGDDKRVLCYQHKAEYLARGE